MHTRRVIEGKPIVKLSLKPTLSAKTQATTVYYTCACIVQNIKCFCPVCLVYKVKDKQTDVN